MSSAAAPRRMTAAAQARKGLVTLEDAAAREVRHAAELQAVGSAALAVLREAQADAAAALARARSDLGEIGAQVEGLRADRAEAAGEVAALRAEAGRLRDERSALEEGRAERIAARAAADADLLRARERAADAGAAAAAAERELDDLLREQEEGRAEVAALAARAGALRAEIADLEAAHRPLLPYVPPFDRPRLTAAPGQCNVRLERLDLEALRLHAAGSRTEIRDVVAAALRNLLPHEAYDQALSALLERAEADLRPGG